MNDQAPTPLRVGALVRRHLYDFARLLLVAWAIGLAVTAVQLGSWRREMTRTLLQLQADAQFRARAQHREAVDPEWYRRKALTLLAATERLRHDATWTLFVPGSWRMFDDLEQRLQDRITREFGEIVVETIRRELFARASQLTGVPVVASSGDLQTGIDCQSPVPLNPERRLSAAPEDLPEFVAVSDYVRQVEQLDAAVQAYLSLQYASGQPEQLRKLVAYTLHTELPGHLARSALLFHGPDEVNLQPALMQTRLQLATRCSLGKAMTALHTRLLNTNDLLALEQGLAQSSAGLFEPGARPVAFDRTLERYRAVHALLDDQHDLLSKGRNDWMRNGELQLGPAYQDVLHRIEHTRLLGPDVLQDLRNQSGAAFAEFRRQFEAAFGSQGEPGIVWLDNERRFGLSPERSGLRQGLDALLKASFMTEDGAQRANASLSLATITDEARAMADARMRFLSDHLGTFPAYAQPTVARVVDTRVSELIYQRAYRALKAGLPPDLQTPLDLAAFRRQRDQVLALQAVLRETGAPGLGERLAATLDGELVRRLAVLQDDWNQQPLNDARSSDFQGWQGELLMVGRTVGAPDAGGVPGAIAKVANRLELLDRQAKTLMALGSPALAADPVAQKWLHLETELERYQQHGADSSLLRLERYLTALGPDLKRENCAERLANQAPPVNADDDIAQRLLQIHAALVNRCTELRLQAATVAGPTLPLPAKVAPHALPVPPGLLGPAAQ